MGKKPETKFKEKVAEDLDTLCHCWYEKIQQVAIRGTPDYLCCLKGRFVALELKKDDGEVPSPLQLHKLRAIREDALGVAFVVSPENWPGIFHELVMLAGGRLTSPGGRGEHPANSHTG